MITRDAESSAVRTPERAFTKIQAGKVNRAMDRTQRDNLTYTLEHFGEVARQNRFAENAGIDHDRVRCLVCHPETYDGDPFELYLEVIVHAVKVRRPRLDEELVAAINEELQFAGESGRVSQAQLLTGEPKAMQGWRIWVREALNTGLELLSIHSSTSMEFALETAEQTGSAALIDDKIQEIIEHQRSRRNPR